MASNEEPTSLGPNAWLVEELAQNYKDNPKSVAEDWRDLFADANANGLAPPSLPTPPTPPAPLAQPTPMALPRLPHRPRL